MVGWGTLGDWGGRALASPQANYSILAGGTYIYLHLHLGFAYSIEFTFELDLLSD